MNLSTHSHHLDTSALRSTDLSFLESLHLCSFSGSVISFKSHFYNTNENKSDSFDQSRTYRIAVALDLTIVQIPTVYKLLLFFAI
jgi:hypothetical protein